MFLLNAMFNYSKPIPYFCEIKSRTIKVHDCLTLLQLQTLLYTQSLWKDQMVHEKHKLSWIFAPFCWSMKYDKTKCQGLPRQVSQAEPRKSNNICFAPSF